MSDLPYLHPILSSLESQEFEKSIFGGNESLEWKAMNRAGKAIADQALLDIQETLGARPLTSLLILVGKGHNGGDAIIATRHLLKQFPGAEAHLVFPFGLGHLRPLVQRSMDDLQVAGGSNLRYLSLRRGDAVSVKSQLDKWLSANSVDICLDGILGMQFRPPLRSPAKELIEVINQMETIACRIAVDVPSGIGDVSDKVVFKADFTYATGIAKAGLFFLNNRPAVGRIRYLDLGFFDGTSASESRYIISNDVLGFRRELRESQVHKKTFGHLFVVGGSATMPGAILMTVRAALKSGVGLVTAFVPESIVAEAATRIPEAMWVGMPQIPEQGGLALEGLGVVRELADRATGWALGPGMGKHPETGTLVEEILLLSNAPVLLDADALRPELVCKDWDDRSCVITPHVGEFNRLLGRPLNESVEETDVREFAGNHKCITLLKGSPTAIVQGGRVAYSCFGGPVLARGGSGDVLAGLIGGRISIPDSDYFASVLEGASWHGWAADRLARALGQTPVKATDVLSFL
ncbi:MAG: NAD(P)H-hydrate dehydratase [Verrucomicrobia bacterium]|nr:NAD(P)H-hydrate dehydratase [Verrucomicrobiota bacterium]